MFIGKNSLLGTNTGSAHSAGPGALVAGNDQKREPSRGRYRRRCVAGGTEKVEPSRGSVSVALGCQRVQISKSSSEGGKKPEPFCNSGAEIRTLQPAGDLTARAFNFFARRPEKKSGAQKARFAYVVSFKKCDFRSLSATAGFGGPGVPKGSTFRCATPRAAKNQNSSTNRGQTSEPSSPRVTQPPDGPFRGSVPIFGLL